MDIDKTPEPLRLPAADADWDTSIPMSGTEWWLSTEPELSLDGKPED